MRPAIARVVSIESVLKSICRFCANTTRNWISFGVVEWLFIAPFQPLELHLDLLHAKYWAISGEQVTYRCYLFMLPRLGIFCEILALVATCTILEVGEVLLEV